jgi:peptidyl-prolyl cis-trans isomerase D
MLEVMRRNSRNAIIYVLFGVIIAVFIINFGPGSRGCTPGASASSFAAKVGGSTLTEQDFRFAYIALTRGQVPSQMAQDRRLKEFVMDKLIERELLAQEAERLGFQVSAKEVEDMIADGRMMVMGVPRRVDDYVFKGGKFDYERFKMVAQNTLGVTVVRFIEIERRELLADKVRELMKMSAKVSPDEVKADFEQKGLQVNLEYARFSPRRFEDDAEVTPAEIDAYVKAHGDELKKMYEERAFLYKKVDKQARLRHILAPVEKSAPQPAVDAAKKAIDAAAAKVKSGTPFAEVAKAASGDDRTKKRGGLVGWRKKGFTGFSDALDEEVFAAQRKKGDVVGPMRTDRGFELVLVEDFREGDVPLEVAQRELAEDKVREERSRGKAKVEADAVLARVKKGEKLEDILPKQTPEEKAERSMAKAGEAPKLQETGLFSRHGEMVQEIGVSKELAKKAFDMKVGEIGGPFEVAGGWVIARVKDHREPDMADFEKRKPELMREYERTKYAEVLDGWAKNRCAEVRDDGRIKVNEEILSYEGVLPSRNPLEKAKYEPCSARLF